MVKRDWLVQDTPAFGRVAPPIRNDTAQVRRAKKHTRFLMVLLRWLDAEWRGKALDPRARPARCGTGQQKRSVALWRSTCMAPKIGYHSRISFALRAHRAVTKRRSAASSKG